MRFKKQSFLNYIKIEGLVDCLAVEFVMHVLCKLGKFFLSENRKSCFESFLNFDKIEGLIGCIVVEFVMCGLFKIGEA